MGRLRYRPGRGYSGAKRPWPAGLRPGRSGPVTVARQEPYPHHLDGRYLRNGSNPIGEIDPELYHWFIGDGMVHGIRIRDGKAEWYRNRWVRGPMAAKALGDPSLGGHFGISLIGANTNVIGHAGKTLALIEGGIANYEITDELDHALPVIALIEPAPTMTRNGYVVSNEIQHACDCQIGVITPPLAKHSDRESWSERSATRRNGSAPKPSGKP